MPGPFAAKIETKIAPVALKKKEMLRFRCSAAPPKPAIGHFDLARRRPDSVSEPRRSFREIAPIDRQSGAFRGSSR
jgi:hypothetical protein